VRESEAAEAEAPRIAQKSVRRAGSSIVGGCAGLGDDGGNGSLTAEV
jgi:hypothetical protein